MKHRTSKRFFIKRRLFFLLAAACFLACGRTAPEQGQGREAALNAVTTIFPPFDFVRALAGNRAQPLMLLKPGAEAHSYEPSPRDIITIRDCDLFIYVGGESEAWADRVLGSLGPEVLAKKRIVRLMDCVETVEEEITEGMQEEEGAAEEKALDEHVWTSPQNAKRIIEAISAALCGADPANAAFYLENAAAYVEELDALDAEFRAVTAFAVRKTLVFGDRFPFRYLADAYGLSYYAAFPGCSSETEASAATTAFLINKVKNENIPVVFQIEFSSGRMADVICEASGARKRLLHSAHNVSRDEFLSGITYLEIMKNNVEALKEALY